MDLAASNLGNRILKVDHGGEQGAICVYRAHDEQLHHDRSLDGVDVDGFLLRSLQAVIGRATEVAIWLGMRL